ncbi:coiled-coil domain-containing protein 102A isoform X1 [Ixodes scapularis]|nr:coiled-coil domain-containing protein 102A isoform X1 [Ixodes scapularis]
MSSHVKRETGYRPSDPEWEAKEELRLRELEEARARAAQMEKTMRWWSDCTANWREKWSKVRTERNKAREDVRLLRGRVDAATKEAAALKRDKQELEAEVDQLRRELDYLRIADDPPSVDHEVQLSSTASSATHAELEHLEKLLDAEATNGLLSQRDPEQTDQRTPLLQLRLDEAAKLLLAERQEKNQLAKMLEKQATELGQLKAKYDELRKSRQDTLKELSQVKAEHQDELECIRIDLEDEASGRTCLDKRLTELRAQLVQLQGENAAEWGRRERLETEKLTLERDNKNLRASLQELQECLQRKAQPAGPTSDLRTVQAELQHRTKELLDLKHAHSKLKKVLQEKSTELSHALRRSDQYEMEVKKLRGRIEELKKELATAEDEVDSATNNIRKLQRCNDELQEQVETLQVQLEHLQTSQENLLSTVGSDTLQVEEQCAAPTAQSSEQPRRAGS